MRVLVTTSPGLGHILPVLPLAVELGRRGHDLHWVVAPGSEEPIVAAGIEVTAAGMSQVERHDQFFRRHPDLWTRPEDARPVAFSTNFAELAAPPMIRALRPLVADWRPDLILHDAAELAAPLVAAAAGIPSVCHGFGEVVPEPAVRRAGTAMASWWAEAGMTPDPYAGSYRGLYVDIYPPALRSAEMGHVPRVQLRQPASGALASGSLVYVTFGTVFNSVDDGFRVAVRGAAAVADEVLVTVGPAGDPDAMGPVPDNVQVARYVPQAEVLPRCAAVVCHGGSGTVLAALAHGVPLLCLPRGADQFDNAVNVARAGVGTILTGLDVTEVVVRRAMEQLLESPDLRAAARALAHDIAAMPGDDEVATAVVAFAAER